MLSEAPRPDRLITVKLNDLSAYLQTYGCEIDWEKTHIPEWKPGMPAITAPRVILKKRKEGGT